MPSWHMAMDRCYSSNRHAHRAKSVGALGSARLHKGPLLRDHSMMHPACCATVDGFGSSAQEKGRKGAQKSGAVLSVQQKSRMRRIDEIVEQHGAVSMGEAKRIVMRVRDDISIRTARTATPPRAEVRACMRVRDARASMRRRRNR